ncbi:unnamed protein product [marine sediment metagenome]|uniref:Uncharacterized protein n=1 Tax=marine sediment metagenome TaxID=412755 RepID=X1D0S8_9ZZZZ
MGMEESKEDPERRIKKGLEQIQTFNKPVVIDQTILIGETEIQAQIREAAYYIALKCPSYDELCWSLAEKIQTKYNSKPSKEDISEIAENIYYSSKTHDELCWLNAEIDMSAKK